MNRSRIQQKNEKVELTILEAICLMSAWTGQSLEQIKKWKIPYFMKMMKAYGKDVKMRRVNL